MRKFRNAALAGMTALSLVTGTATIAMADGTDVDDKNYDIAAGDRQKDDDINHKPKCEPTFDLTTVDSQEDSCTTRDLVTDIKDQFNDTSNSSVWGNRYNADKDVTGRNLLGLEKNFAEQPIWSQIWYVVTALGVVGTVIGMLYLPFMNQLKNMGIII